MLRDQIISELVGSVEGHPGETLQFQHGEYVANVTLKRAKGSVDRGTLEQLLWEKNIWHECTTRQVEDSLVEQAFIEGKLTDSDLRSIGAGEKIQPALKVEKCIKES